uniref:Uncharacterized protein n=1 Tax=Romanomermis culicivorax TaxID=13658 RepID=A0A915I302_ROMCU
MDIEPQRRTLKHCLYYARGFGSDPDPLNQIFFGYGSDPDPLNQIFQDPDPDPLLSMIKIRFSPSSSSKRGGTVMNVVVYLFIERLLSSKVPILRKSRFLEGLDSSKSG